MHVDVGRSMPAPRVMTRFLIACAAMAVTLGASLAMVWNLDFGAATGVSPCRPTSSGV